MNYYNLTIQKALSTLLTESAQLNTRLVSQKMNVDLQKKIQDKLRFEWTYHSNAIEGSTLNLSETIFFLQEGLTVAGKPFKDFLDAKNHMEAIDFLSEIVNRERPISEGFLKELNALLLKGVAFSVVQDAAGNTINKPVRAGAYKTLPNHVLQLDGTIHRYVDPLQVPTEMAALCQWIHDHLGKENPIIMAAIAHYNLVRIHPFDDGNGRGARLLMNLILMLHHYPPAIIKMENRKQYLECLAQADQGDLQPFITLVAKALLATQKMILDSI